MDEYNENLFDDELLDLIERFEHMIHEGSYIFFNADDLIDIIEYYIADEDKTNTQLAIMVALNQHPKNCDLLMLYVHYLVSKNHLRKALSVLDEIEILEPNNPDVFIMKGNIYSSKNKPEQAIIDFNKAIEKNGKNSDVHYSIAKEYIKLEQFHSAIEHYKKSLDDNHNADDILLELWKCYESVLDYSGASDFFISYTNTSPYSQTGWFYLGNAFKALGLYEKAIEACDFATVIDDTYTDAYILKATVYEEIDMPSQAIVTYEKVLFFEIPDAEINSKIGINYLRLGNYEKAIEFFNKAVKLVESNYYYWYLLGDAYREKGQFVLAEINLNKALSLNEFDNTVKYKLALLYQDSSDYVKSEMMYQELIEFDFLNPPQVYLSYADLLVKVGKTKKAIKMLKQKLELVSYETSVLYRLATLTYRDGKKSEGLRLFSQALIANYEIHNEIFAFAPELMLEIEIIQLIEDFNPQRVAGKKKQKIEMKPKRTKKRT